MSRNREVAIVWILLSAPIIAWVLLLDLAVKRRGLTLDFGTNTALIVSLAMILGLSFAIVESAHENWRLVCRYMAATFFCEALLLYLARSISGPQATYCAFAALVSGIIIFFGSTKH